MHLLMNKMNFNQDTIKIRHFYGVFFCTLTETVMLLKSIISTGKGKSIAFFVHCFLIALSFCGSFLKKYNLFQMLSHMHKNSKQKIKS